MSIQKETCKLRLAMLFVVLFLVSSCAAPMANRNATAPVANSNANSSSASAPVNLAAQVPSIEFRSGKEITTLTFSDSEMDAIEREVLDGNSRAAEAYIMSRLASAGKKCCEPRKRLDACTWRCCNGDLVKTCNQKLAAALKEFD